MFPLKRKEREINILSGGDIPAGSKVDVKWEFSGNNGDIVFIALPGTPDHLVEEDEKKSFRVDGSSHDEAQLTVPTTPREYELRYYDKAKEKIIARKTFTVGPPGIKLKVPEKVIVGTDVKVEWSGPSSANDVLFVAAKDWPKYSTPKDKSTVVRAEEGELVTLPTPTQCRSMGSPLL